MLLLSSPSCELRPGRGRAAQPRFFAAAPASGSLVAPAAEALEFVNFIGRLVGLWVRLMALPLPLALREVAGRKQVARAA